MPAGFMRPLEEFGPGYFALAQLTRVTTRQFRDSAPEAPARNERLRAAPRSTIRRTTAAMQLVELAIGL